MPSTAPPSPDPSSPASSTILSPSSNLTLSSDLSAAPPQKLYRLASQHFLTKRFPEASQAIQPLLRTADRKWLKKAWGLYLVILDNGLKMSPEEGKRVWGRQAWKRESDRVKRSTLWDELQDGVQGNIGFIDAELIVAMYVIVLLL
jgi:hypothetical protein